MEGDGLITEEYFDHNGRICYYTGGRGEPLIFLHNGGNDHRIWDHQMERFVRSRRVFALDLPGYGKSADPDARFECTLDFYTGILEDFIRLKKLRHPVLVGNCLGSAMSLSLAMKKPEMIGGLVLFNILSPTTLAGGIFGPLYKMTRRSTRFEKVMRSLSGRLVAPGPVRGCSLRLQYGKGTPRDPGFGRHVRSLYARKGQLRALYGLVCNMNTFEDLERADFGGDFPPVLVIWGGRNRVLPLKAGSRVYESKEPAGFRVFRDAGHLVMRECCDEVNGLMGGFLDGLQKRTGRASRAPRKGN